MIAFTVLGLVPSMKNSRRLVRYKGSIRPIKSKEALDYEKSFAMQVPASAKQNLGSREHLLCCELNIWYPDYRRDVDGEFIFDLLQKNGVVANDRWLRTKYIVGYIGEPKVRIKIWERDK